MPNEMSTVDADRRYIYCYCKEDKGGDMSECNNKKCSYGEWFHLDCLKMKNLSYVAVNGIVQTAGHSQSFLV